MVPIYGHTEKTLTTSYSFMTWDRRIQNQRPTPALTWDRVLQHNIRTPDQNELTRNSLIRSVQSTEQLIETKAKVQI